ncbi:MAG: hypothetical protein KVP17_002624 [Porospora cf. gigantea B]|nr:MAG: hypothetical protein KVP17_002624 [Porospora cf. gigantea B]
MMLRELWTNGPLGLAVEPNGLFKSHRGKRILGGGFTSLQESDNEVPLRKVDHAVTLTGFGFAPHPTDHNKLVPYWEIYNPGWPNWGDNGFARIERGTNYLECEAAPVFAHIKLLVNN